MSDGLATADFGNLTVFYRYARGFPAIKRGHGQSEPAVDPTATIQKVVVGEVDITDAIEGLFGSAWSEVEARLVGQHNTNQEQ